MRLVPWQVKIYQGKGWLGKFKRTHFDSYTPPDFYVKVSIHTYIIIIIIVQMHAYTYIVASPDFLHEQKTWDFVKHYMAGFKPQI